VEGPRWGPPPRRQTNVILWIGGQTPFADAVRACRVGNRPGASAAGSTRGTDALPWLHFPIACLCD
jgi:hypothetical protein